MVNPRVHARYSLHEFCSTFLSEFIKDQGCLLFFQKHIVKLEKVRQKNYYFNFFLTTAEDLYKKRCYKQGRKKLSP
jgi:hypothetical protein